MKRIALEELERILRAESYERLCTYVYAQIQNGSIKPLKASGTNGKKPALYREYWIVQPDAEDGAGIGQLSSGISKEISKKIRAELKAELEEELNYKMSTKISTDYYMRHLGQYQADRRWVQMLNEYLLHHAGESTVQDISKNERSFQIWGREKFLQMEQGKTILRRCGVDASQLSFYETSEPLAYYSRHREIPQNILIIENKDTFYSMRRHLINGGDEIFGISFGTLIYGAGKGILRSFQDFSFSAEPYMRSDQNGLYYFGDLDYEGIGMYERLAESFQRQILPFAAAYEQMMKKSEAVDELPMTKEKQNRRISGRFFEYFSEEMSCAMRQLLESGRYIPQEIINICDYGKYSEK